MIRIGDLVFGTSAGFGLYCVVGSWLIDGIRFVVVGGG